MFPAICLLFSLLAATQPPATPSLPAADGAAIAAPATEALRVPANSIVVLELVEGISSQSSLRGDKVKFRLAEPIVVEGRVLVPAGAPVVGEIVHAQKSSGGGRAGELIVAARYVDAPQAQIKLRASLGKAGKDGSSAALAASLVAGPFAMFVHGRESFLPAGTRVSAKTAIDISLSESTPQLPSPMPATPTTPETEGSPAP